MEDAELRVMKLILILKQNK